MENINKYDIFLYYNHFYKDFCTAIVIDDNWHGNNNLKHCVIIHGDVVYIATISATKLKMHNIIMYGKMTCLKEALKNDKSKNEYQFVNYENEAKKM